MTAAERRERAVQKLRHLRHDRIGEAGAIDEIIADLEATDEPTESPADRALRVIREADDETRERWRCGVLGGDDVMVVSGYRNLYTTTADNATTDLFMLRGVDSGASAIKEWSHFYGTIVNVSDDLIAELFRLFPEAEGTMKPQPKGPWRPEYGQLYFYRTGYGEVASCPWYGGSGDDKLAAIGNTFPTYDRCEADGKWTRYQSHMLSCAVEAWEGVAYDEDMTTLYVLATGGVRGYGGPHRRKFCGIPCDVTGQPHFPTRESAQAAIDSAKAAGLWIWDEVAG